MVKRKSNLADAVHGAARADKRPRHLPMGVRDQLKILAAEQRTTMAALAGEGLNAVFAHYGRPEIAPTSPRGAARIAGERRRGPGSTG